MFAISKRSGNLKQGKLAVSNITQALCKQAWRLQCSGETPHPPDWLTEQHSLSNLYGDVHVCPIHVCDHRSNRFHLYVCAYNFSVCAPYVHVYMSTRSFHALCLFRLGMAPLHMYCGRQTTPRTHVLARTCQFCESMCNKRVIEDEYHVCVECPLYDSLRVCVYRVLLRAGFNFPFVFNLVCLCMCMLNVRERSQVQAVGSFLADCLALRDAYLGKESTRWCSPARAQQLRAHTLDPPTTSRHSMDFLHNVGMRDLSLAQPFATLI